MTVTEIIKQLGGAAALARKLGLPPNGVGALRVRAWGYRNSIPAEHWSSIAALARAEDLAVTLELLADAHASRVEAAA